MRLSVGFTGFGDLPSSIDTVRAAEEYGYDGVWMAEHVGQHDAIVPSVLYAQATTRLEIGLVGLSPVTRHPGVTAMELASLCEIAPGRVRAAVGTGQPDLIAKLGQTIERPLSATVGFTNALKALMAGRELTASYPGFRFENYKINPLAGDAPLDIMGIRPKMVRAACEVGDGLSLSVGASRQYLTDTVSAVEGHLKDLGRERHDFRVWALALASVGEDLAAARARVAPVIASAPPQMVETLGAGVFAPGAFGEAAAGGVFGAMRALTPDVVDQLAIVSTPDALPGALAAYAETGIDELAVFLLNPPSQHREILRALAEARP